MAIKQVDILGKLKPYIKLQEAFRLSCGPVSSKSTPKSNQTSYVNSQLSIHSRQ